MTIVIFAVALVASLWHPIRAGVERNNTAVAGWRLLMMFGFFLAMLMLPRGLDSGQYPDGLCPGAIVPHSAAWLVKALLFGAVIWSGIGVAKAVAASALEEEETSDLLAIGALILGLVCFVVAWVLFSLAGLCLN
jgi:hypothetical protein